MNSKFLHYRSGGWSDFVDYYPDGCPIVRNWIYTDPENKLSCYRFVPSKTTGFKDLLEAISIISAQCDFTDDPVFLDITCLPGARQDVINKDNKLDSLGYILRSLNSIKNLHTTLMDVHSVSSLAAAGAKIKNKYPDRLIDHVNLNSRGSPYIGIISPDAGARKRAEYWSAKLGVPVFQAWKTRGAGGNLSGFDCEPLLAGKYLVVDDICDAGGTFIGLAAKIRSKVPAIHLDLAVTHGYFSSEKRLVELTHAYNTIYTTDSLVHGKETENLKIKVIPL